MTHHKRVRNRTMEQRIWRLMRVHPDHHWSPKSVATWLQLHEKNTSHALCRLLKKGCVTATGATNNRRYRVTALAPEDYRGLAEGTIANLVKHGKAQVKTQPMRRPRVLRSTVLLEQLWRPIDDRRATAASDAAA